MIINVWRPKTKCIDKKQNIIYYSLCNKDDIYKNGSTNLKIIWKCDNMNCKFPNKLHSISRHHLNINRSKNMYEDLQICRSCQTSGEKNPKYGDNRTWDQVMGVERSKDMKNTYKNKFISNNPSKTNEVKIKKNQIVINFENVSNIVDRYGFKLIEINGNNKQSMLRLICPNNHSFNMRYFAFKAGHRCMLCFYESLKINIEDIEKIQDYYKKVRYLTRSNFRKYSNLIDPDNLKSDSKNYHIDHIYSVFNGFKNNIDPTIISSYINLRVITQKENLTKGTNSDINKEELLEKYNSI